MPRPTPSPAAPGASSVSLAAPAYFARAADGQILHVSTVARGRACACTCLGCAAPLIARQGEKVSWHFAHDGMRPVDSCAESALHEAGKNLLSKVDSLLTAAVEARIPLRQDALHRSFGGTVRREAPTTQVYSCAVEVVRGSRRLDAVVQTAQGELGVEILVTHRVDRAKSADLDSLALPTLEIDLSGYIGVELDEPALVSLLKDKAPRRWVGGYAHLAQQLFDEQSLRIEQSISAAAAFIQWLDAGASSESTQAQSLVAGLGLSAEHAALWDWKQWWVSAPTGHSGLPVKPFAGVHHQLWQSACLRVLHDAPGRRPLLTAQVVALTHQLLGTAGKASASADQRAMQHFVAHLTDLGWVRGTLERGYALLDIPTQLKAIAFRKASRADKEAQVLRWSKKAGVRAPVYNLHAHGKGGFVASAGEGCWQSHVFLRWLHNRVGQAFTPFEVEAWFVRLYGGGEKPCDALYGYLALLTQDKWLSRVPSPRNSDWTHKWVVQPAPAESTPRLDLFDAF